MSKLNPLVKSDKTLEERLAGGHGAKAVVAIECTEQEIQALQEEKASLVAVKNRITAMADKIRSLVE